MSIIFTIALMAFVADIALAVITTAPMTKATVKTITTPITIISSKYALIHSVSLGLPSLI